jgi:2Fe-2S ferredoxin
MGGVNPYIAPAKVKPPTKKYKVTFLPLDLVVEVDPAAGRKGHDGLPFSILDIAEGAGVELDHSCGGVCACSTCHVYIRQGMESCNPASEDEYDQLDNARGPELDSRLGCQCVPDGSQDVVVEIPDWNRNLVRE